MSNIARILIDALADKLTNYERTELLTGFGDLESASREIAVTRNIIVMGSIVLGTQDGLTITHPSGARSIVLEPIGSAYFGKDVDQPAYTSLAIFSEPENYNSEAMGAGDVLLGDNSSGKANLLWDASTGQLKLRGGTTEGIVLDTDGTLIIGPSTPNIVIDGVNKVIRSSNYSSGAAGFQMEAVSGDAEFNNITARGTFKSAVFEVGSIAAVGGHVLVSKNAGEVAVDVQTPDAVGLNFDLVIKDDSNDVVIAAVGDVLRIKTWEGDEFIDVWATVEGVTPGSPNSTYDCNLDSGDGWSLQRGMAVVNYGPAGAGVLHLEAGETTTRLRIATHAGAPWTTQTNMVVLGNMRGTYDTGANDRYGIGIGDYSGGNYLSYNAEGTGKFILKAGGGNIVIDGDAGTLTTNENVILGGNTGLEFYGSTGDIRKIAWLYDTGAAFKTVVQMFGDYGGSGDGIFWLRAQKNTGDPWTEPQAILTAMNWVTSKDVRVAVRGDGTISFYGSDRVHIVSGDINTVPWTPYHDTSTIVGWTSYTQKVIEYKKIGTLVFVNFRIAGTSDSINTNFSLPFSEGQAGNPLNTCLTKNDGTFAIGYASLTGGSAIFIPTAGGGSGSWTAAGSKAIYGQLVYETT